MDDKFFLNIFKVLFFVVPVGLITGPFIPDLAISLMALLFLVLSIKNNLWKKYYDNKIIKFLLILNLYLIIISLFSENIFLSLKSSLFYFRFILSSIAIWYLLERIETTKKRTFTIYFFILFLILSIDAIFQYIFGQNIFGFETVLPDRVSSLFGHQLVLGSFQSRLLILLIGLIITYKIFEKKNFLYLSVLLILSSITIFLSGERTSFGLFILSIILFFFLTKFSLKFFTTVITSLSLILLIAYLDKTMRYRIFIERSRKQKIDFC